MCIRDRSCTGDVEEFKFNDSSPISSGFAENVEFLELEYLDPAAVELDRSFDAIAPMLWMRAGGVGPIVREEFGSAGQREACVNSDRYGVLFDPSCFRDFLDGLPATATHAFVVTDSRSEFAHIAAALPDEVEAVQLYENYLTTLSLIHI